MRRMLFRLRRSTSAVAEPESRGGHFPVPPVRHSVSPGTAQHPLAEHLSVLLHGEPEQQHERLARPEPDQPALQQQQQ